MIFECTGSTSEEMRGSRYKRLIVYGRGCSQQCFVHHSARAESALPIRTGIIDVIFLYATQQFCTIRPGYVSYRHLTTPDIAPLGPAERHDLLQLGPLKSGAKAIDDDEAAGGTKPRELDSIVFLSNEALFALKPSRILFHRPCVCFSGPKTQSRCRNLARRKA
jgi:hypothetical protein